MKLSVLILISMHLGLAFFVNFLLKFVTFSVDNTIIPLVQGNEFSVVYLVLLLISYMKVIDNFNRNVILDPVTMGYRILKTGLEQQQKILKGKKDGK